MKATCEKCNIEIDISEYTDLYRIEEHHLHPSFMDNPNGLGERISLCHNCHIEILHPLIHEIVLKHSNLLSKKNKSFHWVWKYHVPNDKKQQCIEEVKTFTLEWLKE